MLPVILQMIGGIIAYYALRQDDPAKAKNCLLLGCVLTAIGLAVLAIPIILLGAMSVVAPINASPPEEFIFLNPNLEV